MLRPSVLDEVLEKGKQRSKQSGSSDEHYEED